MKKILNILLVVTITLQLAIGFAINLNATENITETTTIEETKNEEESDKQTYQSNSSVQAFTGNVITNVVLTQDGVTEYNATTNKPYQNGLVQVLFKLDWKGNQTVPAGSYTYTIPDDIYISSTQTGTLSDGVTYVIGTDNVLTVTFSKEVTDSYNEILIKTAFKDYNQTDAVDKTIEFPLANDNKDIYNLSFRTNVTGANMNIVSDRDINPSKFTVTNTLNRAANALEADTVYESYYSIYKSGTQISISDYATISNVKVATLNQLMNGTMLSESKNLIKDIDYEIVEENNLLKIKLLKPCYQSIIFTYDITVKDAFIIDESIYRFGVGIRENNSIVASAATAISHVVAERLQKSGYYYQSSNYVRWTVDYNNSGETLRNGTVLLDTLTDEVAGGSEISASSISITEKIWQNGGWTSSGSGLSKWDISKFATEGKLTYIGQDTNNAYTIIYNTNDKALEERKVTNKITDGTKEATKEVELKPGSGSKYPIQDTLNIQDETINWHITINDIHAKMTMYGINDIYGERVVNLVDNSLIMTYTEKGSTTKNEMQENVDYTVTKTTDGFDLELLGTFRTAQNYRYDIDYTSKLDLADYKEKDLIRNRFEAYGPGSIPLNGTGSMTISMDLFKGGLKLGTPLYGTDRDKIQWTILANADKTTYTTMVLDDVIDSKHELIEDSLEFYTVKSYTSTTITTDEKIEVGNPKYPTLIKSDKNKLYLEFDNIGSQSVVVKYKTKTLYYIDDYVANTAKISEKGSANTPLEFFAQVYHSVYPSIGKSTLVDTHDKNLFHWSLTANKVSYVDTKYKALVIEDYYKATVGQTEDTVLLKTSFEIKDALGNTIPKSKYTISFDFDDTDTSLSSVFFADITANNYFKIVFNEPVEYALVTYDTYSTETTSVYNYVDYVIIPNAMNRTAATSMSVKSTSTEGGGSVFGDIPLHKMSDVDGSDLSGAVFELFNATTMDPYDYKITTGADGTAVFENLEAGTYLVKEIQAPSGYIITEELEQGIELNTKGKNEQITENYYYEVINLLDSTSVVGVKTWDDNNDQDGIRPTSITVNLLADGTEVAEQIVTETENWEYNFTNLPKYANGIEIEYTITEDVVAGYITTISENNITNTHEPEVTLVTGIKTWEDNNNQDGIRPTSITVNLLANGTEVTEQAVTAAENWEYSFINLPKYNQGTEIIYTVTEDNVENYTTTITGTNIINTYTPGQTSLTITKSWNDQNDKDGIRPESILVQIYANDKAHSEAYTLNDTNNWTITVGEIEQKENGLDIIYSVGEVRVADGYVMTIANENIGNIIITNTHEVKETVVPEEKEYPKNDLEDTSDTLVKTGNNNSIILQAIFIFIGSLVGFIFIRKMRKKVL